MDTKDLLAKINTADSKTALSNTPPASSQGETTPVVEEKKFQHYESARQAVNLITDRGTKICFVGHKYITADPHTIEYMNEQISLGLQGFTKGKLMTAEEANPMAVYKKKILEEAKDKMRKELLEEMEGNYRDMGTTKAPGTAGINPASTRALKVGDASSSAE